MLNPLLLWFLPLALVPILLHLMTLRRLRTVELSTFRFLLDGYRQQRRKLKLLEYLLMLLRAGFIVLLVLALSRPVVRKFDWLSTGQSGRQVAIVVDAGATMAVRTGGTTSLERARQTARQLLTMLGPADHLTLVEAGDPPRMLLSRFAAEPEPFLEALDQIRPAAARANLAEALAVLFEPSGPRPQAVYVISDQQETSWSTLRDHPIARRIPTESQLTVMNVGPVTAVSNLAVLGDPPPREHLAVGLPVLLRAVVVNGTAKPVETTLSVMLGEEQVEQFNLSLQPGERKVQAVTVTPTRPGLIRGRFQLPGDDFPEDDSYLFALNVAPRLAVTVVSGRLRAAVRPGDAPDAARLAGEDPALYLHTALTAPRQAFSGAGQAEQRIADALQVTLLPQTELSAQALEQSDVLILADVQPDAAMAGLAAEFVRRGGGLMILPGPSVSPEAYQPLLAQAASSGAPGTPGVPGGPGAPAPLALGPPVGDVDNEALLQPIGRLDRTHPILAAFRTEQDQEGYFATVRLARYFPITLTPPGSAPGSAPAPGSIPAPAPGSDPASEPAEEPQVVVRPLMHLVGGTVVLAETRLGEGKILLAGFPATPDWSNLPLKPPFVPMLLRAVSYLRRPPAVEAPSALRPHQVAAIHVSGRWPQAKVEARGPGEQVSDLTLHRAGERFSGALMETAEKGYYTFRVHPRLEGAPPELELGLAVNLDLDQAEFRPVSDEALAQWLPGVNLQVLRGEADDPTLVEHLSYRREIWRELIWLLFAIIGAEFLLATLRSSAPASLPETVGGRPAGAAARTAPRRVLRPGRARAAAGAG